MTPNPDYATFDTTILDAMHTMHDGKFLHVPVLDRDGRIVACLDVLQLTHAAISMAEGGAGAVNDVANTIMQKFWDSALALEPPDEEFDSHSEVSILMASEAAEGKYMYPPVVGNSFAFKLEDQKGRMHRFSCGSENLAELISAVTQRIGMENYLEKIQLLYEDDEGDRVLLATDSDLSGAVNNARSSGLKVLRLHIDDLGNKAPVGKVSSDLEVVPKNGQISLHVGLVAGAVALASVAIIVYLKRLQM